MKVVYYVELTYSRNTEKLSGSERETDYDNY